jgi:hypothetical protein
LRPFAIILWTILAAQHIPAQVYSPKVTANDQPDSTDLRLLAQGIYKQAGAKTPRQRAEAIWRFFLTDGRYVAPGFWYHIAGWAYEEPLGEVLDPLKLLNSYGFGLCYQIAPVLEAVWKAGGFEDARVWFLTGHTVAEVYYDGSYHHFDSDMLGYSTVGGGPAAVSRVASVHELEKDGSIILGKLIGPKQSDPVRASSPWYPADVRAGAIGDLAGAFTSAEDNSLFPHMRSPLGHAMDFVLRPGEKLIRYFKPEREGLFYLPYKWTGGSWEEFPREFAQYSIRTADGPASQKDQRRWSTGRIEYRPAVSSQAKAVYDVRSPWVIIDAEFEIGLSAATHSGAVKVETSTDDGISWTPATALPSPAPGRLRLEPAVLTRGAHGRRTAVSGQYGYKVRVSATEPARPKDLLIVTRIQLNPRALPGIQPGRNELTYAASSPQRRLEVPVDAAELPRTAHRVSNARRVSSGGQGYWLPTGHGPAEFIFRLVAPHGEPLSGLNAGGRFLDLSRGLAPDKFTAEVRTVAPFESTDAAASIAWSASPAGPFRTIWQYQPALSWKDGDRIDRVLLWPEVDRHTLLPGLPEVYVRYQARGLAIDDFRLAGETRPGGTGSALEVTHLWREAAVAKSRTVSIPAGTKVIEYLIETPKGASIENEAIIFECKREGSVAGQ